MGPNLEELMMQESLDLRLYECELGGGLPKGLQLTGRRSPLFVKGGRYTSLVQRAQKGTRGNDTLKRCMEWGRAIVPARRIDKRKNGRKIWLEYR